MDNVLKNKIEQIISSLETETINIATKIDLNKEPTDNYSRTRDLINIGSVILWLKNCLKQGITSDELEQKIKLFEEVIKDHRYTTAGAISEIAYQTNRLIAEALDEKETKQLIEQIIYSDENKLHSAEDLRTPAIEDFEAVAKRISTEASKDAARLIKTLLNDEDYIEKVKTSGYRIDEEFVKPEYHRTRSLLEQINNSIDISNRLNRIIKQIKQRNK